MSPLRTFALLALVGAGCNVSPVPVYKKDLDKQRFTRVNLRFDGNVIYSSNFMSLAGGIVAGTPARITMYSNREIRLTVGNRQCAMKPIGPTATFPTDEAGVDAFLAKYFVDEREQLAIEGLGPPELTEKVLAGVQMIGMTKEQVYTALGPPYKIGDETFAVDLPYEKILEADHWQYADRWRVVIPPAMTHLYFGDGKLQRQEP